jgi:hypothetical protein
MAGTELIASFFVPSSPARDVRPISADELRASFASTLVDTPELIPVYNDWGLRDRPRSIRRPAGIKFRSVFVGDSFLEGYLVSAPLSAIVERKWAESAIAGMEAINFGVNATGPRQYYYRIQNVALALQPDVIVLSVYAGNDFISTPFRGSAVPPLVDELPTPSLLGFVAPRTDWLVVNKLGLSEAGRGTKDIPGEFALLNEWAQKPEAERLDLFVRHMKANYYPNIGEDRMREILSRGGGRLWEALKGRAKDREFAAGWFFSGVIGWETGQWEVPHDAAEADRMAGGPMVEETLSWILAAEQLAKAQGIQLIVMLVPTGVGDPNYVEFWKPWPRYFSYSLSSNARHKRLAILLRERGLSSVDLRDDLDGVSGTYRLTDGHWTELGTAIAAERLSRELRKAFPVGAP